MINLLIGPPGGGKSYEAVVYHVLANLEAGRKVITNLPLNIDELAAIVPAARMLVEFRNRQGKPGEPETWAFGSLSDYGDSWRDPVSKIGPLYVIDECHKALPRRGIGDKGGVTVDEWYAEHRHEGADVLLMTQSYGKVSKAIIDQVQVCYRVKKKTAFGDSTGYIRKVQDGVKGDVLSIAERTYEARFFKLYKSHTRTEAAVIEADAKDIAPGFLKWKKAAKYVLLAGALGIVWSAWGLWSKDTKPAKGESAGARTKEHAERGSPGAVAVSPAVPVVPVSLAPKLSKDARIVGIVTMQGIGSYAVVYTADREYRFPLLHCSKDDFDGWICLIDGELVSMTTGPQPPTSTGGVFGGLVAAPST